MRGGSRGNRAEIEREEGEESKERKGEGEGRGDRERREEGGKITVMYTCPVIMSLRFNILTELLQDMLQHIMNMYEYCGHMSKKDCY